MVVILRLIKPVLVCLSVIKLRQVLTAQSIHHYTTIPFENVKEHDTNGLFTPDKPSRLLFPQYSTIVLQQLRREGLPPRAEIRPVVIKEHEPSLLHKRL